MEFKLNTMEFQRVVKVLGITAKIGTEESSGRVYIESTEDNKLIFISNLGTMGVDITVDQAEILVPGHVTVSYGDMRSFVSSFAPYDGSVGAKEFHLKEVKDSTFLYVSNVHGNGKETKGKIKLTHFDNFGINRPIPVEKTTFIMHSQLLKEAIEKISYAIDPKETRTYLQGPCITFTDKHIIFVGSNAVTLSEYRVENRGNLKVGSFLFKMDFAQGLRKILGDNSQVFFNIEGAKIEVKIDNVNVYGRMVIGCAFPDYQPLLENFSGSIELDRDMLMECLTPFRDLLDPDDNKRLSLTIQDKKITFSNNQATVDSDSEVNYDKSFSVDVNGAHMINTISVIKDAKLNFKFSDDTNWLVFDSGNLESHRALITKLTKR
jgi:DNA polymerase III sliding clamp (beta) subunit (PCNA family)